jgi:hypothetical protein
MNAINMPGFTAEHSLYRCDGQSYACASDSWYTFDEKIIPQACIVIDGQLVCDLPRIPRNPRPCATCRSSCYIHFRDDDAKLNRCLDMCPCDF